MWPPKEVLVLFISKKPFSKVIGVLGGMGPEATVTFYRDLILLCQEKFNSKYDDDYPNIIIYNLPVPDVVEGINKPKRVLETLEVGLKTLENAGADFIVMPCNTINYFYEDMKNMIKIPLYNIIEETTKEVKYKSLKKIGILATKTTIKTKLYDKMFKKYNLNIIRPSKRELKILNEVILNIMEGKFYKKDKKSIIKIIRKMQYQGAEGIILGCTELPLIIKQKDVNIKVFDTITILANATIKYATL